jgi:hypothetical protein
MVIMNMKNIETARRLFLSRHGAWMSQASAVTGDTQYNALYGLQDEGYVVLSKKDDGENRFRAVKRVRSSETEWNVWKGSRRLRK